MNCRNGQRCHVSGTAVTAFGDKGTFSAALVGKLASSSVQLVAPGNRPERFASGTLIWPNVVLCAAHSLETFRDRSRVRLKEALLPTVAPAERDKRLAAFEEDLRKLNGLEILLFYECDGRSSPRGEFSEYDTTARRPAWRSCSPVASRTQAEAVGPPLEEGDKAGLDYALLAIKWKGVVARGSGGKVVKVPRIPFLPRPSSSFSREVLVIGHPWDDHNEGEPTQASAGTLYVQDRPNFETADGTDYAYAGTAAWDGMSGGGLFNERGEIVGVLKGRTPPVSGSDIHGDAYLELGRLAARRRMEVYGRGTPPKIEDVRFEPGSERIRRWLAGGPPLLPGGSLGPPGVEIAPDPKPDFVFST